MNTQSAEETGAGVSLEQEEEEAEVWQKWFEAEILMGILKELSEANEELNKELTLLKDGGGTSETVESLNRQLRKLDLELQHAVASSKDMEHDLKSKLTKAENRAYNAGPELIKLFHSKVVLNKDKAFLWRREVCRHKMLREVEKSKMATAKDIEKSTEVFENLVKQLVVDTKRLNKVDMTLLSANDNEVKVPDSLPDVGESTKIFENLVTKLAVEREHFNMQLSSLASENKILVAKLKQKYKDPSREDTTEQSIDYSLLYADNNEGKVPHSLPDVGTVKRITAKDIGENTKAIKNLVTQLAVERDRLNMQLSSLESENKILEAKLKQTYKDPSQEATVTLATDPELSSLESENKILEAKLKQTYKDPSQEATVTLATDPEVDKTLLSANDNEVKVPDSLPDVGTVNFKQFYILGFVLLLSAMAYLYFNFEFMPFFRR